MPDRWIGYTQQNIPGTILGEMRFFPTLAHAARWYETYCYNVGYDDCSMTLYYAGNDQSMYDLAKEYEEIGCPFDYPDRVIEHGPRGGVKVTRC